MKKIFLFFFLSVTAQAGTIFPGTGGSGGSATNVFLNSTGPFKTTTNATGNWTLSPQASFYYNVTNYVFVDATNGSDSTGAIGKQDLPFKTVKAAIAAAPTRGSVVYVLPGTYTDLDLTNKPNMTFFYTYGAIQYNTNPSVKTIFQGPINPLIIRGLGVFTNGPLFTSSAASFDVECDSIYGNSSGNSVFDAFAGNSRLKARLVNNPATSKWVFEHPGAKSIVSVYDTTFYQCSLMDLGQVVLFNCTLTNTDSEAFNFGGSLIMIGGQFSATWPLIGGFDTGSIFFLNTLVDEAASIPMVDIAVFGNYYIGDVTTSSSGTLGWTNYMPALKVTGTTTLGTANVTSMTVTQVVNSISLFSGPTNNYDMAGGLQHYVTFTPCAITGFVGTGSSPAQQKNSQLVISNAASTNITFTSTLVTTPDGLRTYTVTNGTVRRFGIGTSTNTASGMIAYTNMNPVNTYY